MRGIDKENLIQCHIKVDTDLFSEHLVTGSLCGLRGRGKRYPSLTPQSNFSVRCGLEGEGGVPLAKAAQSSIFDEGFLL
jgi:hypothetical protein